MAYEVGDNFAEIVEILDTNGASFVSVTQQFNTTSSMGRLTLNVLLSFAQFEREVMGERIRDKRELDLGKPLVLDFAREFLPDDYDEVRHIFSRRGAYRRYKNLLERRGALENPSYRFYM